MNTAKQGGMRKMDKEKQIEVTEKAIRSSKNNSGALVDLLNKEIEELQKVKEKQIEELGQDIYDNCPELCEKGCGGKHCYKCIAESLQHDGYRKINENELVISKEEYEKLKTQLRIKTNEADWRANQLQALDKDFEVLEKVVKCKNCKWLAEKHYEELGEEPYIKLVCMLTKRQCQLNDFCSYGEENNG